MDDFIDLYRRLRCLPFPTHGKMIGDFILYDSLIAGCADRISHGGHVLASEVPLPDDQTLREVARVRAKGLLNKEEQQFLEYFELLERLRQLLLRR